MMKKLTKIKLINWHYLSNETIDIEGNCLITGENGAGKSTILDAIQYVMTAGKQQFNSAANEKAKRDLLGYVRCKTGRDTNQYEREGDVTAHVALEFFDENKKKSFIIGTCIDSSSNLSAPKVIFYRMEDETIDDSLYIQKDIPRNISNFKANARGAKILTTQTEARKDFRHRFGSLNERFFDMLPKALAFRPINNVKDFVYSYLLDEKDVDIEYLKENIHTLREYESYLNRVKKMLQDLSEIDRVYNDLLNVHENINIQEYMIKRAKKELNVESIQHNTSLLEQIQNQILLKDKKLHELKIQIQNNQEDRIELEKSLSNNDTFQLIRDLEKRLMTINDDLVSLTQKEKGLDQKLSEAFRAVHNMNQNQIQLDHMEDFYRLKQMDINETTIESFFKIINQFKQDIKNNERILYDDRATFNIKLKQEQLALENIEKEINSLKAKKLVYPRYVVDLQQAIQEGLKREIGKDIEPKILCELLNIKDERWQNAIEGYLNTQRFNLIVEPEYFDRALQIYERVKFELHIHTTGLVNTKALNLGEQVEDTSLAYMITSQNPFAESYVHLLLKNVVRCETVEELKHYPTSITSSCMVYKNKTARQIKEEVYKTPFIGQEAYKKQLELKILERDQIQSLIKEYNEQLKQIGLKLDLYQSLDLDYIMNHIELKIEIQSKQITLDELEGRLATIDRSTFLDLEENIKQIKSQINKLEKQQESVNKELIDIKAKSLQVNDFINTLKNQTKYLESELEEITGQIASVLSKAEGRYLDAKDRYHDLKKLIDVYESQHTGLQTRSQNVLVDLQNKQRDYNRDYDFGAALGLEGMDAYHSEYKTLKDSKVIEYEEKIRDSKKKAEEQFKDEFISKLQENILMAQAEFKKLNHALKGIYFGEDEYKFEHKPDKENAKFYNMIMDDSNIGGDTLFSGSFRDKHKEALDELFDRISLNDEQSQKALEEFTDYRTYMDYDIKILHRNGSTSSFSRVCREKSGGETQTPYYVAIAASFIQMYHSHHLSDSIGLMLFDEAFDKMDENRIESMMEFLNKLDLQVILAAPPQKIETISPFVSTNLVVYRDGNMSYVEAFHHEG